MHFLVVFLLLVTGHWWGVAFNLPVAAYRMFRLVSPTKGKVDMTHLQTEDPLKKYIYRVYASAAFYVLMLFYYLMRLTAV